MFDFSQVDRFATRLHASGDFEEAWRAEWSQKVADEWQRNVPVDTGEYRDSIHVTPEGAAASARHAPYVEYGTHDTRPQPALLPAVNRLSGPASEDAGARVIRELT